MTQNNPSDKVEVIKLYYKSGALWSETPYEDGKEHGIKKWYHESGSLRRESQYENGKRHGIDKIYYESSALMVETPYVRGNIHGIVKSYEEGKSNIYRLALYEKGHKVASVKFGINGDRS